MASAHSDSAPSETANERGWITPQLVTFCLACLGVTVIAGLIQVSFGSYSMTIGQAWRAMFNPDVVFNLDAWESFLLGSELPEMNRRSLVVWNIRLPRVFVAAIVGASLAVSGAIFQAVTRNELASPYVLGVSSGAGLVVLLTLVVFPGVTIVIPVLFGGIALTTSALLPLLAALGGTIAFLLVYGIAWKGGTSPVRLVLAGVIVNMVFQSLQRGLFFFADSLGVVQSALAWITGSLTGTGWEQVRLAIVPATFAILLAVGGARQLNVLLLGERTAKSLGMRVERMRFLLSGVAILAASTAIAVAGIIGFFGLVVPHVVRIVLGSDYRRLIIGCLFAGPALMVVADVGARLALSPVQIPVGVVTGVVGGPYFLYLMRKQQTMGDL
ncbi:FecCD family ABC transporter permease [Haloarcula amylovorans]|uniref:FecCD family ABC transporter permease n=1 Tax=Haloarcula amylovorans TaxID=2562280 RepID=UPI0010761445|nr:iron ABC transporter permease [Halomicroarcula amylolytica]